MKIIAIVGFGFCGRLALAHLVKKSEQNTKILIFDKNGKNALGPAFSGFSPHYILNVTAVRMSAFSEAPKSFCEFLQEKYPQVWSEIGENGFAPRQIYGKYVEEFTQEAFAVAEQNGVQVEFVSEEVTQILKQVQDDNALALRYSNSQLSLHRHPELASGSIHFALTTSSNNAYQASEILLATSFKQSNLPFDLPSENLVKKLWDQDSQQFHQQIFTNETICLIGSGLTAVDVIVGLKKKNFSGKIFVISRRGNFPKKHFAQHQPIHHFIAPQDSKKGLLFLCLKIRNFLRQNPQFDLRHVIDSVRYSTVELWQNFDEKNKKLFLRLLPYWNIFRHRAPISSVELIEEMIASGQIEIKKKGVKKISEKDGKILIETRGEEIECDYAVNCLGFEFKLEKYPLLAQMVDAGLLKKDLFLAQSNHPQVRLLGGLNVGRDFECTAVPDLRLSVESLF